MSNRMIKRVFIFLATAVMIIPLIACAGKPKVTKPRSQIVAPFDGTVFDNLEPFPDKNFFRVFWWQLTRPFTKKSWPDRVQQKFFEPEVERSQGLKIAVLGHAMVLIQIDNMNFLTDAHFSERASPFSWVGPRRVTLPGIPFDKLPPIDGVLISHDHYDALDLPSLKRISDKWGSKIYVGLGNRPLLEEFGINHIIEMDWWETVDQNGVGIRFVPVQHWSARGTGDKKETLWGGFVIHGFKKQVFFAGDTGYATGKVFRMIQEKLGPMDLSLIPIGAYEPRDFMKNAHVWPAESVKIFKDTKSKHAVGIHFGTFADLTDEAIDQPATDLKKALSENGIAQDLFIIPEFGRTYSY